MAMFDVFLSKYRKPHRSLIFNLGYSQIREHNDRNQHGILGGSGYSFYRP